MTSLTHEFTHRLPATRERVFRALTDDVELTRWFAEHVEIEPHPGGEFRFWGKHTYGAPTRAQSAQKVVTLDAPGQVVFSWPFGGYDSEVTLNLLEAEPATPGEPPATLLRGRHHFPVEPADTRALDLVDDLWRIACANLRAYISGSGAVCLPDFSDPIPRLRHTVLIAADRDAIFTALLDPATLDKWISAKATVEPHVGGWYNYGWTYDVRGRQVEGGPTRILELVDGTKLVTDWPNWRGDPTLPRQRITWLLEPVGDHTRVTLIHEPFERTADLSDYPQGWAFFLDRLKKTVETA
jgi:uncharacterized protein YndB with AHSA1/START domain